MSRVLTVIFLVEARAIMALGRSKEQLQASKGKLGHVAQIHVLPLFR